MKIISAVDALKNLKEGIKQRTFRFPSKNEDQCLNNILLPKTFPKFHLTKNEKIFTIGSCFAREIEDLLENEGFNIPIKKFTLPSGELPHSPAHLLNEYNAGTILQRIENIFGLFEYNDKMGIEGKPEGFIDLFLHIHNLPVTWERLIKRRNEINEIYKELLDSTTLIITMGLTESWYDNVNKCYLNKAPSKTQIIGFDDRFEFHRMDVDDVLERMTKSIELLNQHSKKNILLTVSPIPLEATFTSNNAILANMYSKSTLRIVAEKLKDKFDNVDYFPSFEIALSGGIHNFKFDNIHIEYDVVKTITNHMISNYYLKNDDEIGGTTSNNYIDDEYTI